MGRKKKVEASTYKELNADLKKAVKEQQGVFDGIKKQGKALSEIDKKVKANEPNTAKKEVKRKTKTLYVETKMQLEALMSIMPSRDAKDEDRIFATQIMPLKKDEYIYECIVDVKGMVTVEAQIDADDLTKAEIAELLDIKSLVGVNVIRTSYNDYIIFNALKTILSFELIHSPEKAEPAPEVKEGLDGLKEVAKVFDGTEFGELFNEIIKTISNAEKMPKLEKPDKEQLIGMFEKLVNAGIESMEKEKKEPSISIGTINFNITVNSPQIQSTYKKAEGTDTGDFTPYSQEVKGVNYGKKEPESTKSKSLPFAFIVKNTTDKKIENIQLFNSLINCSKPNFGLPEGIDVQYLIPDLTFQHFMEYLKTSVVEVGSIQIISETKENLNSYIRMYAYNLQGDAFTKQINFGINTFQTRHDARMENINCYLTDTAEMKIEYLMPNSEIQFNIFPKKVSSKIALLNGGREFKSPSVEIPLDEV